jgi:hypothetical protein
METIPVSIPVDCVKSAQQTTSEIDRRARDFMIASTKPLKSARKRAVVTGYCATRR